MEKVNNNGALTKLSFDEVSEKQGKVAAIEKEKCAKLAAEAAKIEASAENELAEAKPAMIAAKNMEHKILDQLQESGASKQLRSTAFEMSLFGTGVMKGPFAIDKDTLTLENLPGPKLMITVKFLSSSTLCLFKKLSISETS